MSREGGASAAPAAKPAPSARFPRRLRLKQRRLLRPLFARGRPSAAERATPERASVAPGGAVVTAAAGCVRLLARRSPASVLAAGPYPGAPLGVPMQVAFVPGRQPSAVVRNRVRRSLREVYRVHHGRLVDLAPFQAAAAVGDGLAVAILFRGTVGADLHTLVARDLPRAFDRLGPLLATAPAGPATAPDGSPPGPPAASSHNRPAPLA